MAESFIKEELAAQLARNEKLLQVFAEHGADPDELRPIDFFFYTADREAAEGLARDLVAEGFETVQVTEEEIEGKWAVQAVRTDSVNAITAEPFVEKIVRLAARYLAEFDGWGAPI